jgi:uncharacterized protein YjbJ (UPF0337 family)
MDSGQTGEACATLGGVLASDPGAAPTFHDAEGWCAMGAESDQVKGKVKEAAGMVTGDKDLEAEGKADRRAGEAKEKVDEAKDKVQEVLDKAKDKVEGVIDKAKDTLHRK